MPGWRDLIGRPLEEIVAAQWERTLSGLLDDLEPLPRDLVACTTYDRVLAEMKQSGDLAKVVEPFGFPAEAASLTTREALCEGVPN